MTTYTNTYMHMHMHTHVHKYIVYDVWFLHPLSSITSHEGSIGAAMSCLVYVIMEIWCPL
jgi:hypothetical protein